MKARTDIRDRVDELIVRWCNGDSLMDLAADFDCDKNSIRKYIRRCLSKEFYNVLMKESMIQAGRVHTHHFKPGVLRGTAARRHVQIGTIRVWHGKNRWNKMKTRFYAIKVRDECGAHAGNWEPLAIYVWRAHYGPVPRGHSIMHKNGNCLDNCLENLICVTNRERLLHIRALKPERFKKHRVTQKMRIAWKTKKLMNEFRRKATA